MRWAWLVGWAVLGIAAGCGGDGSSGEDGGAPADAALDTGGVCDADAECDDGLFCNGAERCDPADPGASTRGCVAGAPPCAPSATCDDALDECTGDCATTPDADGDGHDSPECGGDDCDDSDPGRFPGNTEVCDDANRDEDCDPLTFGVRDEDGDGHVDEACCNEVEGGAMQCGDDCDDSDPGANPEQAETCDTVDNDCDGDVDEGTTSTCWPDLDNDGYAEVGAEPVETCGDCGTDLTGLDPEAAPTTADCDDSEPLAHPGGTEVCDGIDNDCSSGTGEAPAEDMDGDGHSAIDLTGCDGGFPKDDCNDRNPDIFGGQKKWFPGPACPERDWCDCAGSVRQGCPHPLMICNCETSVWDYDCSGAVEHEPKADCNNCDTIVPGCGDPGPTWTSLKSPPCGGLTGRILSCGSCETGCVREYAPEDMPRGCH